MSTRIRNSAFLFEPIKQVEPVVSLTTEAALPVEPYQLALAAEAQTWR